MTTNKAIFPSLFILLSLFACGPETEAPLAVEAEETSVEEAPVTWVDQSKVERQSIGNCWVYATTGWAESLNKTATGTELNLSQSYVTYWHWFDQIVNNKVGVIATGGSYATALNLFDRYGLVLQSDFIPEEATAEMSLRQASAEKAINVALKTGALSTAAKRADRKLVRAEMDKAWGLNANTVRLLDAVFGNTVSKNLERSYTTVAPPGINVDGRRVKVLRPVDLPARAKRNGQWVNVTLRDVMGTGYWRAGALAWKELPYPTNVATRRAFQQRVQRALNDHQPVVLTWFVDFNALGRDGSFTLETLNNRPGRQGSHMVVMMDYEAVDVPGFGRLPAGVNETRPEALEAALKPEAKVAFFRVKNSWGTARPDRWDTTPLPGYHDLGLSYLDGPIKRCALTASGETDTTNCTASQQPWRDVVLPPGY